MTNETIDFRSLQGTKIEYEGNDWIVPQFSRWNHVCGCLGCNLAYFPDINRYFFNQWEVNCMFPIWVVTGFVVSFLIVLWTIVLEFENSTRIGLLVAFSVVFLIWICSYISAVCHSPGYLPFYWRLMQNDQFNYEQQMDGVITMEDQYNFAFYGPRPERSSLSRQARRLVLKADHICKWLANWVGLKNYRYFYQKLIWSLTYFAGYMSLTFWCIYRMVKINHTPDIHIIIIFVCFIPVFCFSGFLLILFVRHTGYLTHNFSTLQEYKAIQNKNFANPYDLGCFNNCSQTMGPKKYCPIWFFPVIIPRDTDGFNWILNT